MKIIIMKTNNYLKLNPTMRNSALTIKPFEMDRWLRALLWSLGIKDSRGSYYYMIQEIKKMILKSGNTFTVRYLKESTIAMNVWIGKGDNFYVVDFPIGIQNGLPKIIPFLLRNKIRQGDRIVFKAVISILSLYRILSSEPNMKLNTITDPFNGISSTLNIMDIKYVRNLISGSDWNIRVTKVLNLTTAGPNYKVSWQGAVLDAKALVADPCFEYFKNLCSSFDGQWLLDALLLDSNLAQDSSYIRKGYPSLIIGKLSKKFEAAGKVRVFAITDWWTQVLLKPLHDKINEVLLGFQQDGTFDQTKPLDFLTGVSRYSYDLSAATDRLPIDVQVQVLSQFVGQDIAINWSSLLTKREWFLIEDRLKVKYSVGQPMGAYSSFPMLALTHHFIVQIAAKQVGYNEWFTNYALLGDDIVIAEKSVADRYYLLMNDVLGVSINLSKSIQSETRQGLEFAKRLRLGNLDYSAIGPKSILQSIRNINFLPSLVKDCLDKQVNISSDTLFSLCKDFVFSNRVSKFTLHKVIFGVVKPFGLIDNHRPIPLFTMIGSPDWDSANRRFYRGIGEFKNLVTYVIKSKMIQHLLSIRDSNVDVVKRWTKEYFTWLGSNLFGIDLYKSSSLRLLLESYEDMSIKATIVKGLDIDSPSAVFNYSRKYDYTKTLDENIQIFLNLVETPVLAVSDPKCDLMKDVEYGNTAFNILMTLNKSLELPSIRSISIPRKRKVSKRSGRLSKSIN
jgi:hypothetical protein